MLAKNLRHVPTLPNYFALIVLQQVLMLKWQPCSRTIFLVFLPAKIVTTSFPAVDPIGSPLISDLIEFTPEVVYSKIMKLHNSKNPRPDG